MWEDFLDHKDSRSAFRLFSYVKARDSYRGLSPIAAKSPPINYALKSVLQISHLVTSNASLHVEVEVEASELGLGYHLI